MKLEKGYTLLNLCQLRWLLSREFPSLQLGARGCFITCCQLQERLNWQQFFAIFVMKDFTTYLSTAPVVSFLYFGFLAGLLIEINRFFPDALVFPFLG